MMAELLQVAGPKDLQDIRFADILEQPEDVLDGIERRDKRIVDLSAAGMGRAENFDAVPGGKVPANFRGATDIQSAQHARPHALRHIHRSPGPVRSCGIPVFVLGTLAAWEHDWPLIGHGLDGSLVHCPTHRRRRTRHSYRGRVAAQHSDSGAGDTPILRVRHRIWGDGIALALRPCGREWWRMWFTPGWQLRALKQAQQQRPFARSPDRPKSRQYSVLCPNRPVLCSGRSAEAGASTTSRFPSRRTPKEPQIRAHPAVPRHSTLREDDRWGCPAVDRRSRSSNAPDTNRLLGGVAERPACRFTASKQNEESHPFGTWQPGHGCRGHQSGGIMTRSQPAARRFYEGVPIH